MSYEQAVKELSPCGLDCSRCVSYKEGKIVKLSQELIKQLTGFERMANLFKNAVPVFQNYTHFLEILKQLSTGSCPGCRYGDSACNCKAKDCHKDQKVDFCFQCSQYPCTQENVNEKLYGIWKSNNNFMKDKGVEDFYIGQKQKPRY